MDPADLREAYHNRGNNYFNKRTIAPEAQKSLFNPFFMSYPELPFQHKGGWVYFDGKNYNFLSPSGKVKVLCNNPKGLRKSLSSIEEELNPEEFADLPNHTKLFDRSKFNSHTMRVQ